MLRRRLSKSSPPVLPEDDDSLIALTKQGNRDAYNVLVVRYERSVFNLAYRMMGNTADAEDVTQDAFLRGWQSINSFDEGSIRAWLMRIATNRSLDKLRSSSRHPHDSLTSSDDASELPVIDEGPDADPVLLSERLDLSQALQLALDTLPADQRLAVILCDVMHHSHDEAAAIAGAPPGTIKSRVSRGREKLRKVLREREEFRELVRGSVRLSSDQGGP